MPHPTQPTLLCGTDFSEPAQRAADVAATLSLKLGAKLLVAHGIDERGEIPRNFWGRLMAEDQPRLAAEVERLRTQPGAAVEGRLLGGAPDDGVARCAEREGVRLIVVASSGLGAAGRWLMGSVSERIAETAQAPTLVVRDPAVLEGWLRSERTLQVFVAADFTALSDTALQWTRDLMEVAPCAVTVGYVDREADARGEMAARLPPDSPAAPEMHEMLSHDLREKARTILGQHPVEIHVLAASDRVDLHLLDLAAESGADLIVTGAHQWHGWSRLRHPSVSRRILHGAKVNVACVPSRAPGHGVDAAIPVVQRVLVATDLSPLGTHVVRHAFSILPAGGSVRIVHVAESGATHEALRARMQDAIPADAGRSGMHVEVEVIEDHDVPGAICRAAESFKADVVCVGSHGRGGLLAQVVGSVTRGVISSCARPLLLVRPPEA